MTAYEMRISDWSSDVCSSDLDLVAFQVRSLLKSDWQNIDAENDDAIDGAVLLRHRGKFLGRMLFVQVKSGPSFKLNYQQARFQGMIGVKLGKEYIATHRPDRKSTRLNSSH